MLIMSHTFHIETIKTGLIHKNNNKTLINEKKSSAYTLVQTIYTYMCNSTQYIIHIYTLATTDRLEQKK